MRVSTVSILLVGGIIALGACSTSVEPRAMTLAERTEQCQRVIRAELVPTGRKTGDARNDYDCRSVHAPSERTNVTSAFAGRSAATDRALRNGG